MMRRRQLRRVRQLVEENYWDGFFAYLGDGFGPSRGLVYTSRAPSWWNAVADVAYEAGYLYAREAVEKVGTRRIGTRLSRDIPPRVWADAFGAARLPS